MMDFSRQGDIVLPFNLRHPITVIGLGGIGSPTTLALAKMGVRQLRVYDGDTVEDHNLPNQIFRAKDLGKNKAEAVAEMCEEFAETTVSTNPRFFTNQDISGIVVSGVDSMAVRKAIWERMKNNDRVPWYIDGRMGGEVCRILTVNPCDPNGIEWYEGTLYSDEEALELPCTRRAVIYCSFAVAALIASQVKKISRGEFFPKEIAFDLANLTLVSLE